jgi:hypothetical protein
MRNGSLKGAAGEELVKGESEGEVERCRVMKGEVVRQVRGK